VLSPLFLPKLINFIKNKVTYCGILVTHATPENEIVEVVNTAVDEPIETHEDVEAAKENTKTG
jgi:hypothetical protein